MTAAIGIDTGGTFTDLVAFDLETGEIRTLKTSSTPDTPGQAIANALHEGEIDGADVHAFTHGTTVGTNALIERTGCRVAFLTTAGFEDTPYIQRINRKVLYDLQWTKPVPLVGDRRLCLGVPERMLADGSELTGIDEEHVRALCRRARELGAEAVAICLLYSYLDGSHEDAVRAIVEDELPGLPVSVSYEVAPIWREYERSSTVIADAYLKPLLDRYVGSLDASLRGAGVVRPWTIMKSNGGAMLAAAAADSPIQTVMSGPAGGMIASRYYADLLREPRVVTLDIGGTSADVGLIVDYEFRQTTEYEIEWGLPAAVPVTDIKSIGAGGGSIAWVDRGGFLRVGPRSAGAKPGPICYGRGGTLPTVTDANLLLGRLDPAYFLAGRMQLDLESVRRPMAELGEQLGLDALELAASIVEIANENMASAIKMVSLERGHDPRRFSLLAFGGAGGLHAAAIARSMGIPRVIVPPHPGVLSALGLLLADIRVDKIWTQAFRSTDVDAALVDGQFARIAERAIDELRHEGFDGEPLLQRAVNMRYLGQNYEHEIEIDAGPIDEAALARAFERFGEVHRARYGYEIEAEVIELVSFKVTAIGRRPAPRLDRPIVGADGSARSTDVYFRGHGTLPATFLHRETLRPGQRIDGPAVITEAGSTTLLEPGMSLEMSVDGSLIITTEARA
jgi:N-methylhydantoinase A